MPVEPPHEGAEVSDLPIQVSVVVPSTRGDKQLSKRFFERRIETTREWFDSHFGGDTTVRGSGGYLEDGRLIDEPVAIVEASTTTEKYNKFRGDFATFVESKQKNWQQDTILYTVEGRVFIYPKRPYIDDEDKEMARQLIKVT